MKNEKQAPQRNGLLPSKDEAPESSETPAAPEGEAAPEPVEGDEEQPNVSPEEQQQYDRFVDNCYSVIYDQKTIPKILKSLDSTDDPKMNLANTVVLVVKFVDDSARKAEQQISMDVLMHGGAEVMEDLADLAGKMSIHQYTPDEIEGATYIAMDLYREMMKADGTLDMDGAKNEVREVMMAEQEGRLDDLIPGVGARYGAKKGKPAPDGEERTEEPPADEPPADEED